MQAGVDFVDWRTQPPIVKCHCCGAFRNNYQPRDVNGQPDIGVGWYAHIGDGLIWCDQCWQKKGYRKYHGRS